MPLSRRFFLRGNKAIRASMVWVVFSFSTLAFSSQAFAAGLYNVGAFWIPTFYHLPNDTQGAQWTTSTISLPVTATGQNNLMVVGMSWCCNGSGHIPTVSDNKGNTWTVAKRNTTKTACDTTGDCLAIDYAVSATAGVTTVSIAPNTEQYVSVIYGEFNGNVTSGFFDNAQFASPTNNVVTSTPLTPTNPGELIICASDDDNVNGPGVALSSPFTAIATGYGYGSMGIYMSYLVSGGVAPVTCTYDYTGGSSSDVSIIETAAFVSSH